MKRNIIYIITILLVITSKGTTANAQTFADGMARAIPLTVGLEQADSQFSASGIETKYLKNDCAVSPGNDVFVKLTICNFSKISVYATYMNDPNRYVYVTIFDYRQRCVLKHGTLGRSKLPIQPLPAGVYYIVIEGEHADTTNSKMQLQVTLHSDLPTITDLGTKGSSYTFSDTQNTLGRVPYYYGIPNYYDEAPTNGGTVYKISLTEDMHVRVSHLGTALENTGIDIWKSGTSSPLAFVHGTNVGSKATTWVGELPKGTYYIVSHGMACDGDITTTIQFEKGQTILNLGKLGGTFSKEVLVNTTFSGNAYGNNARKDVYCTFESNNHFALTVAPKASSTVHDVKLYLLDADDKLIAQSQESSLHVERFPIGKYSLVVEGENIDGEILLELSGLSITTASDMKRLSPDRNYILTTIPTIPTTTTVGINELMPSECMYTVQYIDGLNRPVENVQCGGSPTGADLVTYQEYDAVGRKANAWLPIAIPNNRSSFFPLDSILPKSSSIYIGETAPYSKPVYEPSPLNRIVEQYGPGQAWYNQGKSVKTAYLANNDSNRECKWYKGSNVVGVSDTIVTITNVGHYSTAELYVTQTTDEDGHVALEFKNKTGQTLLTRQANNFGASNEEDFDTYYIYDDFGNKVAVLPPEASARMKDV
ncbi:MAG: DUF6443 domain-containing protein, partial [Mediterranea sp.]|nr:DUF6443 domain-containing protein [Mediterranea sp.]